MHEGCLKLAWPEPPFLLNGAAQDASDPLIVPQHRSPWPLQDLIDGLADNAALIAPDGIILATNQIWKETIGVLDLERLEVGYDYLDFWRGIARVGEEQACRIVRAFREVATGFRKRAACSYHNPERFSGRHFNLVFSSSEAGSRPLVLASVYDVSELISLKKKLRQLTSGILRAQEKERRRIARDLHDGTAQLIVGLELSLMRLKAAKLDEKSATLIGECFETLSRMQREIRSMSFMFHPPVLKRNSLVSALTELFEGFGSRTDIEVQFRSGDIGAASASVESTLYRIAQEALANIHRHARATTVSAELISSGDRIHLIIGDNGIGFDVAQLKGASVGVGIVGMRERVREMGGRFALHSLRPGTALIASLPREKPHLFDLEGDPKTGKFGDPCDSKCA